MISLGGALLVLSKLSSLSSPSGYSYFSLSYMPFKGFDNNETDLLIKESNFVFISVVDWHCISYILLSIPGSNNKVISEKLGKFFMKLVSISALCF